MPVTPTYPGIYIEEILSNSHTITAAPTSVTVFHRLHAPVQDQAAALRRGRPDLQLQRLRARVRRAVRRRLARRRRRTRGVPVLRERRRGRVGGGAEAAVPRPGRRPDHGRQPADARPSATPAHGIVFTGREPVDGHHALTVSITNPRATTGTAPTDLADLTIGYGDRAETYRRITLNPTPSAADAVNTLEKRIGTLANPVSSLVSVAPTGRLPDRVDGVRSPPPRWTAACQPTRSRPTARATSPTRSSRTRPSTRLRSSTCC